MSHTSSKLLAGCLGVCAMGNVATAEFVAYVSSLVEDSIVRLDDVNGDGDYNDAGETTVFFGPGNDAGYPGVGSAQTILVLGVDHVLAGDGEESGDFETRVYELRDLNGDGDAMDAGEATEYWDSILPPPYSVNFDRPKDMMVGPDGAIHLADNNTINFDDDTPEAVWRLEDVNADGDVNDAGEVTLYVELSPPGEAFGFISEDFKFDSSGRILFSNLESSSNTGTVFIIDQAQNVTQFASEDDLFGVVLKETGMALQPQRENPVFAATDVFEILRIVELIDYNENGVIDDNDERYDWYRNDFAAEPLNWDHNQVMDVDYAPDGSLWLLDMANESILRFVDHNGDDDFMDAGEAMQIYDSAEAGQAGGFVMTFPRTVGFAILDVPGDITGDGLVDVADLLALLGGWGDCPEPPAACPADLDGSGAVGVDDLLLLLANWS